MQTRGYWKQFNHTFRDEVYGPTQDGSIWQLCPLVALSDPSVAHVFYDDFFSQTSTKAAQTGPWVIVEDDGAAGSESILDVAGGVYQQFCDGDDNDESYMSSKAESWKFAAGKSLWLEAKIAIPQGSTNKCNWIMGLSEAAGADMILDDEGGPAANYDGAVFFGTNGALTFGFETSNGATQTTTASAGTTVADTLIRLGMFWKSESTGDTTGTVTPYVNGTAGTAHTVTISGMGEMEFTIGVKTPGTHEESFKIDYVKIVQIR
jgi:hypothetical protein